MHALDWRFLPYPGGLLDQPELLMNDLLQIEAEYQRLKESIDG